MPTGYTASISKGQSFDEFVLACSRGMGALVLMRDDPSDAPIPVFEGSDHYSQKLAERKAELADLRSMTDAQISVKADEERAAELLRRQERATKADAVRASYEIMLKKVESWRPPTSDHAGLKDFMVQQISDSISWDCDIKERALPDVDPLEWRNERDRSLMESIGYYAKEVSQEAERVKGRNKWVAELMVSLGLEPPTKTRSELTQ